MASDWLRSSASMPGIGAGGVDKGEHRQPELLGQLHQAQRFAVALGARHAKVAQRALFGVAPFLLAQHHAGLAVEARQPADDALVVGKVAVAVQLDKMAKNFAHVIERVGALAVAGDLGHLPRREVGVEVFGELQAFFAQLFDLLRDIDRRLALHVAQLFDFAFKLGEGLLEIEKNFFGQDRAPGSGSMNSQSANGAGLRRLRD